MSEIIQKIIALLLSVITTLFGSLFGIGEKIERKGIDVSVHNGVIDWQKVKADGVEFAMIRDGYGQYANQKDKKFEENYQGAKAAGILVGAYHYSYAKSAADAAKEAAVCKQFLAGKSFEYPIAYDLEDDSQASLSKETLTAIARTFCDEMRKDGYYVCLYTNLYWATSKLDMQQLSDIDIWISQWASECTYSGDYGIWQNSKEGEINGISVNVDTDFSYKDYPAIMLASALNGFQTPPETALAP